MIKQLIDIGLLAANIISLANNNKEPKSDKQKKEIRETNRQISQFRNTAYIVRRVLG